MWMITESISGADSEVDATESFKQLTELLSNGGFELRKWMTNSSVLLRLRLLYTSEIPSQRNHFVRE